MKTEHILIENIPAVLIGEKSEKIYLFVHGQGGSKEEAKIFAESACPHGWQVMGIDLPEHGERVGRTEEASFDPWHVVPELHKVMEYINTRWKKVALRANSIGSFYSLLAFSEVKFEKCLLVSPLVDMERMIENLMKWSGVSEQRLEEERLISTTFGQTLSFEYLCYVRNHPIIKWESNTSILKAENDEMIDADTVSSFAMKFHCDLTIMKGGEHWFHTPDELLVLAKWEEAQLNG